MSSHERLLYTQADVAEATERLRAIAAQLPEVSERVRGRRVVASTSPTTTTATGAWR